MTTTTTRRRPRMLAAVALVTAAALALSACAGSNDDGDGGSGSGEPVAGGILRSGVVDPGAELDPLTVASPGGTMVVDTVAERLVRVDADHQATPALATAWSVSDDNLTWTVDIRQGVTFNDGTPLTSADVVATYDRILAPDSTSPAQGSFAGILTSVEADGDAVDFTLAKPFSDFPFLLATNNTQILPADYEPGTWQDSFVGTGPFTVKSYQAGQGITFVKNPTYWNAEEIYLDGITTNFYKDQQARVLALQSGEIDGLYGEPVAANLTSALDASRYTVDSTAPSGFYAFTLRVDHAPFTDVKVRQAIAWALDRKAIIASVYGDEGEVGNDTIYGPAFTTRPSGLDQREASADEVEKLLGDQKISFTITTSSTDESQALLIQQQLKKYPNFEVTVDSQSGDQYFSEGDSSPWLTADATLTYWASRPSPSQFYDFIYRTDAIWNASHYSSPEADRLSDEYDATVDPDRRQTIVDELGAIQHDDVPVIVTSYGNTRRYLSKKLHLPVSPDVVDYTGAWLDQ